MNDELSPGAGPDGEEPDAQASMPPSESMQPHGPATAGSLIRQARQAQGLDLASLAAMLKVPLKKLEALEQGRHEDLPGQTFERALAQAACRVLKIDPKPVLDLMPRVGSNTLEHVGGGINTVFREQRGRGERSSEPSVFLRPVMILPALLVIAALVLLYAPSTLWSGLPRFALGSFGGGASAPAASASTGVAPVAQADIAVRSTSAFPGHANETPAPLAASGPAAAAPAAAPPSAAAPPAVDEIAAFATTPPNIPLQVTASQNSWVEVVDAQGRTLLSRTVVAGESVGLDGALPMHVKIGNAAGTRLSLRGENVDLAPWTRDNVARLELK